MNRSIILALAIGGGGVLTLRSGLFAVDTVSAGLGFLLLVLCLGPAVLWALRGMRHLPVFEVYALMHLMYYLLPAGKRDQAVLNLEPEQRVLFLGVISLFLAAAWGVHSFMLKTAQRGLKQWRLWSREVPAMRGHRLPWLTACIWVVYSYLTQFGIIWELVPGTLIPLVRALSVAAGMLGVFVLGHRVGTGELPLAQKLLYISLVLGGTLLSFASGYLAVGTVFAGNAFFAYMVGARRLPLLSLGLFLLFVSFLNYGKADMRLRYWAVGESTDNLIELYGFWFQSSWEQLNLPADQRQGSVSALERANLTDVAVRVVTQSPHPLPFLNGQTYLDSLQLLIPRIIWPDRPSLHVIMNELGLRYGIHLDVESTQSTMISLGQIGEAWANGGWLAVALAGAFFGMFYSIPARVAWGREVSTIGFLFGMSFVGFAVNLEHLAGTLLMTFYQTAFGVLVLLYWLSRRSPVGQRPPPSVSLASPAAPTAPARESAG